VIRSSQGGKEWVAKNLGEDREQHLSISPNSKSSAEVSGTIYYFAVPTTPSDIQLQA
jgi:hypothetical protein